MATPVPSRMREVARAARASWMNGLRFVSLAHSAANPTVSAAPATASTWAMSSMASAASSAIVGATGHLLARVYNVVMSASLRSSPAP